MSERDDRLHEAEQAMWAWAKGERSHINEFLSLEGDASRPEVLAAVAQADAAEVSRWANVVIGLRPLARTTERDEVLVEGSWFARDDLPEILGNFMRSADEHGREAKHLAAAVKRVQARADALERGGWKWAAAEIRDALAPPPDRRATDQRQEGQA